MSPSPPRKPNPGRPFGTGRYGGQPTQVMRIPESIVPRVRAFLDVHAGLAPPGSPATLSPSQVRRPLFSTRLPAGFPSPADDYLDEGCDLNELLVRNAPATFFYTVTGDSMDAAGIFPGDIVVVDRSLKARSGDIVVAVIAGEGHTLKRLRLSGARVELHPESQNPAHPVRTMREGEELSVWGVVTSVVRRLRR